LTNGAPTSSRPAVFPRLLGVVAVGIATLGIAILLGLRIPGTGASARATSGPSASSTVPSLAPTGAASAAPTATPVPTPEPTPVLVPAPLTGVLVSPEDAMRHPIAVMIDDHVDARPQSGFNAASIVWQAPAEGGIPRYMLFFGERLPAKLGPVRSAREYYIDWAAEWRAVYVHHGGSPQALATLASSKGRGAWVYNGDGFRYEGTYLLRERTRPAPHNLYTRADLLTGMSRAVGAKDGPLDPVWRFAGDASTAARPDGGRIVVEYPYETVTYRYDASRNAYLRYIDGSMKAQVDAADGQVVAPKNVVILRMRFGPLNDGHPEKKRLEAADVGSGVAYIATNGRTIKGTWRKASSTAPTLLFDSAGRPVTLTRGQTFVQVIALSYGFTIRDGVVPRGGEWSGSRPTDR
jgi:hypothetical protein